MASERVAVVGASMTQFGERDAFVSALLSEAGAACLDDAGAAGGDLDHLYVANMASGELEGQTGVMNALASDLGAEGAYAARVDQTSASGGAGIYAAWQSVRSGASDCTLLVGGEKMTHRSTAETTDVIASLTHPEEYKHGVTLPGFAGLAARRYLAETDAPREALAEVAVKNHRHGVDNPNAQFRRAVDVETVLGSPVVADPLRLYDFCPITDGASALLFCPESLADEYDGDYAVVTGVAGATDTHVVAERPDVTRMRAVEDSGERALAMADRDPGAVDVAELHDMFTILELLQVDALDLTDGAAWRATMAGETARGGATPVNTSGGLKSRGHPLGATGVAQAHELVEQVTGSAGPRQVDADVGLACNVGGFGNCVTTTVVESA